jgi:hypothetical protein
MTTDQDTEDSSDSDDIVKESDANGILGKGRDSFPSIEEDENVGREDSLYTRKNRSKTTKQLSYNRQRKIRDEIASMDNIIEESIDEEDVQSNSKNSDSDEEEKVSDGNKSDDSRSQTSSEDRESDYFTEESKDHVKGFEELPSIQGLSQIINFWD